MQLGDTSLTLLLVFRAVLLLASCIAILDELARIARFQTIVGLPASGTF